MAKSENPFLRFPVSICRFGLGIRQFLIESKIRVLRKKNVGRRQPEKWVYQG